MAWITLAELKVIAPDARKDIAEAIVRAFADGTAARYGVRTKLEACHWLTQTCFESNYFRALTENLNYSAAQIVRVFKRLAPRAASLARNPRALGEAAYGGRLGNRAEGSGDGFMFRGSGIIQETGRDNQTASASELGMSPEGYATRLQSDADFAVQQAFRWWQRNKVGQFAQAATVRAVQMVSRAVNRGNGNSSRAALGEKERIQLFREICVVLKEKGDPPVSVAVWEPKPAPVPASKPISEPAQDMGLFVLFIQFLKRIFSKE